MDEETTTETITTEFTELEAIGGFAGWVKLPSGLFLNMALARFVGPLGSGRAVVFDTDEYQKLRGDDAEALVAYLSEEAVDLTEGTDAKN